MQLAQDINFISSNHKELNYSGRIDMAQPKTPCFIYAGSSVCLRFRGTSIQVMIKNLHHCWDNYLGYILDGIQHKFKLELDVQETIYSIAENLPEEEHTLILFKRQDSAHYFYLLGFLLDQDATILPALPQASRKIECYGDSVSAGEVSEAIDYVGKPDPMHNGEYSNAWYSYASITARNLGANLHNIAQGGIALLDNTGYFQGPDYIGLETTYDKLSYNNQLMNYTPWDFSRYIPHIVLLAIGQNDAHPVNYMGEDNAKSNHWKTKYTELVKAIRGHYPNALIILKTTILNHSPAWDAAIDDVTKLLNDPKIVHFTYSNNGCGTPGHIRISEAEQMAGELTSFINQFGDNIWE